MVNNFILPWSGLKCILPLSFVCVSAQPGVAVCEVAQGRMVVLRNMFGDWSLFFSFRQPVFLQIPTISLTHSFPQFRQHFLNEDKVIKRKTNDAIYEMSRFQMGDTMQLSSVQQSNTRSYW